MLRVIFHGQTTQAIWVHWTEKGQKENLEKTRKEKYKAAKIISVFPKDSRVENGFLE